MKVTAVLTAQQKNCYELFGYLVLPGLFKDQIADIRAEFDRVFRECANEVLPWEHEVHANLPRQIMPYMVEKSEQLKALTEDERLASIVQALLGDGYQLIGSDGNIYDCGTRWHTDLTGLPYNCKNVKIIFYFDSMKSGEDAFRVLPGSHLHTDQYAKKLKKSIKTPDDTLGISMTDVPSIELPTEPGDIVVFDARIWHSVPYCGRRRHMMSFIYVDEHYVKPSVSDDGYR
jgi:ectoine hydroxylase-related dioxygenase (phytanoyl-CoA dioxygenase family)